MCGIVGIYNLDDRPVVPEVLQRLSNTIAHRGPDDAGMWTQGAVGLAARRLAIIGRRSGHQPLSNEDGSTWVAFNGEIYNHPELRRQLESRGHRYQTDCDTETIVHAYEEWGEECPRYLHGMFAFAVYDTTTQTLFLARDRAGEKPLLYTLVGQQFVFASEFQALLTLPGIPRYPHAQAIDSYLTTTYISAPLTGFQEIYKLPPAYCLTLHEGKLTTRRYWNLDYEPKLTITEADAVAELRHRLGVAIAQRLVSEVPVGAFLSGGIDSSAIVALMCELSNQPVKTISVGFEEGDFSELQHARRVAKRYGTDHTEVVVRPNAAEILPLLVRHYGEPYADSSALATFYLCQAARREVTVALSGDGSDELFAGYLRYRAMRTTEAVPHWLRQTGSYIAAMILRAAGTQQPISKALSLVQAAALPAGERYLRWNSAFRPSEKSRLYTREFLAAVTEGQEMHPLARWIEASAPEDIVDACLRADIMTYLPDDLLVKMDIASMANSVEVRAPFLDHTLMEWAARIPVHLKLHGNVTKYILRTTIRDLVPSENVQRPKMGFGVPVRSWMRDSLRELLCDTLLSKQALDRGYFRPDALRVIVQEHLHGTQDHTYRLWSLLMLELWHREFID
jgi:asparagine synthase (glutamine-hydrolysing)